MILGLIIGFAFGVASTIVMSALVAGSRADDAQERYQR